MQVSSIWRACTKADRGETSALRWSSLGEMGRTKVGFFLPDKEKNTNKGGPICHLSTTS